MVMMVVETHCWHNVRGNDSDDNNTESGDGSGEGRTFLTPGDQRSLRMLFILYLRDLLDANLGSQSDVLTIGVFCSCFLQSFIRRLFLL